MKKNRFIKLIYIVISIVCVLTFFYLLIRPLSQEQSFAHYDTLNSIKPRNFSSKIEQIIFVENDRTSKLELFFGEEKTINNWDISLIDSNGQVIFHNFVDNYTGQVMIIGFDLLKPNQQFVLKIEDKDGDSIVLNSVKPNNKSYLKNNSNISLQVVTYYYKYNYFFLWYPLFLASLLFLIYPYVWEEKNEKK